LRSQRQHDNPRKKQCMGSLTLHVTEKTPSVVQAHKYKHLDLPLYAYIQRVQHEAGKLKSSQLPGLPNQTDTNTHTHTSIQKHAQPRTHSLAHSVDHMLHGPAPWHVWLVCRPHALCLAQPNKHVYTNTRSGSLARTHLQLVERKAGELERSQLYGMSG